MSVHLQIAKQINKHREAQKLFLALDQQRELAIEEVIQQAKQGSSFQTSEINRITNEMNQLGTTFQFPLRKEVTVDMILDFLHK